MEAVVGTAALTFVKNVVVPVVVKEARVALSYEEELHKLKKNLESARIFQKDGRFSIEIENSPPTGRMTNLLDTTNKFISDGDDMVAELELWDQRHELSKKKKKNKRLKLMINNRMPVLKFINPFEMNHRRISGHRLCQLNQVWEGIEHDIQVHEPIQCQLAQNEALLHHHQHQNPFSRILNWYYNHVLDSIL